MEVSAQAVAIPIFKVSQGTYLLARVFRPFQRWAPENPRKQGISGHPIRQPFIYKGYRGACPETPYPRGLPGMSLRAYGNNGEP